jgi:hypothetical protein
MNNFYILHTKEHTTFKDFIKKKPGSISITYVDILNQQEKYLLFDENKSNSVLACELFNKIFDSISNLQNPKYHSIFYYTDTLDFVILDNFINTIENYKKKLEVTLDIQITNLDDPTESIIECLNHLKETKNINLPSKESIQQIF